MSRPLLATLAILPGLFSFQAEAGQSIWNHNGSQMLLQSNGSERIITYLVPRPGISARPGQVLFRGRRAGNRYTGTAFLFRRGCPPAPYRVSGQVHSETRLVLQGPSPIRSGCQITGFTTRSSNSRLVFTYLQQAGAGNDQDGAQPVPEPEPQDAEGPAGAPPQFFTRSITGGKITIRVEDQDDPAQTPIRIDATVQCHSGQRVKVLNNLRTCEFSGISRENGKGTIVLHMLDFANGTCSSPAMEKIHVYDTCQ